jgi:hypothetical protein
MVCPDLQNARGKLEKNQSTMPCDVIHANAKKKK